MLEKIRSAFASIPDHRADNRSYRIDGLLSIALLASCCGLTEYDQFEDFAAERAGSLGAFLPEDGRTPCAMTFERVLSALKPKELQRAFREIVASIREEAASVIACDGKSSNGSADRKRGKSALHMVSAWAGDLRLVLGQVAVDSKSNEIPALRELLALLDLNGRIVVADALHCQRETCAAIVGAGGDYLLPVKGNQQELRARIEEFMAGHASEAFPEVAVDTGHGRIESRTALALPRIGTLRDLQWPGLAGVGTVRRQWTDSNGKSSDETAFYIMSKPWDSAALNKLARAEWGVEAMHWCMDVLLGEDASRICKDNGPENLSVLRHLALNLVSESTPPGVRRMSMRRRMRQALMSHTKLFALFGKTAEVEKTAELQAS